MLLLAALLLLEWTASGQVSQNAPKKWENATYLDSGLSFFRLRLPHNGRESINQELLDTNTVRLIAKYSGLAEEDLSTIQVAPWKEPEGIALYQIGPSAKAFEVLSEQLRRVVYTLADGDIAWSYFVQFKSDGSLDYAHASKCDAKDYDPKYEKVIKEVEAEVEQQMKADGTYGRFGSVHSFWHLKKDKLKARGIEWRSPSELNPYVNYD
jgi:hypothetical protein